MDLEDQANVMGGLQRDRTNQQLQQLQDIEARKAWAAEGIMVANDVADFLIERAKKQSSLVCKTALVAANEIALRQNTDVELGPMDAYYPYLSDSSWLIPELQDACGSSIELRKELKLVQKKFRKFHNDLPPNLTDTYVECLELCRSQMIAEGFGQKLASYVRDPKGPKSFQASEEWDALMCQITDKFSNIGVPVEDFVGSEEVTIGEISPFTCFNLIGFPIDYKESTKEFVIDSDFLEEVKLLFEFNGQLHRADALAESSVIGRCFVPQQGEFGVLWINYLFGWGLKEAESAEPSQKNTKKDSLCFVATTVYGDANHPQVNKLRCFRDEHLMTSSVGKIFVRFYYAVGPTLALIPARLPSVKRLLRAVLDRF